MGRNFGGKKLLKTDWKTSFGLVQFWLIYFVELLNVYNAPKFNERCYINMLIFCINKLEIKLNNMERKHVQNILSHNFEMHKQIDVASYLRF